MLCDTGWGKGYFDGGLLVLLVWGLGGLQLDQPSCQQPGRPKDPRQDYAQPACTSYSCKQGVLVDIYMPCLDERGALQRVCSARGACGCKHF